MLRSLTKEEGLRPGRHSAGRHFDGLPNNKTTAVIWRWILALFCLFCLFVRFFCFVLISQHNSHKVSCISKLFLNYFYFMFPKGVSFFSQHRHSLSLSPFFSRTIFSKINQIQIIRVERVWLWVFTVHSNVLFLLSCSSGGVVNNNFLCNHPLLPFSNYCKYRLLISLIIFLQVAA